MKVRAICDVFHGVTHELMCRQNHIYNVKRTVMNPLCLDFVDAGIPPMTGVCYEFEGMEGYIHRGSCFIEEPININEFKFFKK